METIILIVSVFSIYIIGFIITYLYYEKNLFKEELTLVSAIWPLCACAIILEYIIRIVLWLPLKLLKLIKVR